MSQLLYLDSRKISAKSVTRAAREQLTHQKYKDALFLSSTLRTPNNRIVSDRHVLQTVSINKLSLSPFDDKRFILEGGIKTLPYGHADAIEATDLESDPEWDAPTQDEIEDLFGEEWETDNGIFSVCAPQYVMLPRVTEHVSLYSKSLCRNIARASGGCK